MDLTPRLLEQFMVLAKEKHYGRAAERLTMSQPSLSQAIQRLERIVGVRLLDRGTRGVELTPAGAAFAADARSLLDAQRAALDRARRIASGDAGEIRVGYVPSFGHWHVPRLLSALSRQLPDLRLRLTQASSTALVEALRLGSLDLAFIRTVPPRSEDMDIREIGRERIAVALPEAHPLAGATELALSSLQQDPWVLLSERSAPDLVRVCTLMFRQAGFLPQVRARAEDLTGLLSYVTSGLCVSVVSEHTAALSFPGVRVVPLTDDGAKDAIPVFAVHRPTPDPAVLALLRHTDTWLSEGS
ncbi:LysR family transcriptional regulator [Streptomyces beihaiensis]|uniref:LysR family transcriptional regulator n=1 Tax=Streptomyces beihaiensis TaxID=2984495 RepID=A0ABT3TPA1_9ACTN|nr:LysR family transcriptional regulator [Streptomyces beihaiensis]MCX3058336.1 LysR family transcriptional regulator [Streptomyces beihaiensis]